MLFSRLWWKDAGTRAARTALVVALPFFPNAATIGGTQWAILASTAGLAGIVSLLTSIAFVPEETSGANMPKWQALAGRVAKSIAQGAVASVGTVLLFDQVDWGTVLEVGLAAGAGSLLLGLISVLPETPSVVTPVPVEIPPTPIGTPSVAIVEPESVVYSEDEHTL